MKLIFAQGNPSAQYDGTRHNIGFFVLDELAQQWQATFSSKPKFQAEIAEADQNGEKVLLVKPQTYYNETGTTARRLIDFYKLNPATDLFVIHDELSLPLGVIRTRNSGSDAGNNGIKSLNAHLGTQYARLRIGIYTPQRDQIENADFVLGRFTSSEREIIKQLLPHVLQQVSQFLQNKLEPTKISLPSTEPLT